MIEHGQFGGHPIGECDNFLHSQISKDAVVRFACLFFGEQAEEDEHITDSNALTFKMRLCSAVLTEHASSVFAEHRIVVAKTVRFELSPACT